MDIRIIASGSSGNCYLIQHQGSTLMVECGIGIRKIKEATGFQIPNLAGCLVSHEHSDHAKSVHAMTKLGCDCWMTDGTASALRIDGHRVRRMECGEQYHVGRFVVVPFRIAHDAEEPVGFFIAAGDKRILYVSDTGHIDTDTRFVGMTHIMIECNYNHDEINLSFRAGDIDRKTYERIQADHMGLDDVIEFLKENDLSRVEKIYLIHISKRHGDPERFKKRIEEITGIEVVI